MHTRQPAGCHDQTGLRVRRKGAEGALDVGWIVRGDWSYVYSTRRRYRLDGAQLSAASTRRRIANHGHAGNRRRHFLEKLQPFGADAELELSEPGYIASRPR